MVRTASTKYRTRLTNMCPGRRTDVRNAFLDRRRRVAYQSAASSALLGELHWYGLYSRASRARLTIVNTELLMRLRLHTIAAYIRKFTDIEDIRNTTGVSQLSILVACIPSCSATDGNDYIYLLCQMSEAAVTSGCKVQRLWPAIRFLCLLQQLQRYICEMLYLVRAFERQPSVLVADSYFAQSPSCSSIAVPMPRLSSRWTSCLLPTVLPAATSHETSDYS